LRAVQRLGRTGEALQVGGQHESLDGIQIQGLSMMQGPRGADSMMTNFNH
jgi:hypothetical protein